MRAIIRNIICAIICTIVTLKIINTQIWNLRLSDVRFIIDFLTTIRRSEHMLVIPVIVSQPQ